MFLYFFFRISRLPGFLGSAQTQIFQTQISVFFGFLKIPCNFGETPFHRQNRFWTQRVHKERTIFNPSVCCDCFQKAHPQEGPILQGTRPQGPKTSLATQPLASTRTIKSAAFVYVSLAPLCRWRNTGANTLKGENCVKRQGSSSDKMIAAICSILPTSSCLKDVVFVSGSGAKDKSTCAQQTQAIQVSHAITPLG